MVERVDGGAVSGDEGSAEEEDDDKKADGTGGTETLDSGVLDSRAAEEELEESSGRVSVRNKSSRALVTPSLSSL